MRTEENFKHTYEEAKWFTKFHNCLFLKKMIMQLVLSNPKELPVGTSAVNMEYDSESMVWLYATKSIKSIKSIKSEDQK